MMLCSPEPHLSSQLRHVHIIVALSIKIFPDSSANTTTQTVTKATCTQKNLKQAATALFAKGALEHFGAEQAFFWQRCVVWSRVQ